MTLLLFISIVCLVSGEFQSGDFFDLIVVGGGLGGLSTAILSAREGKSVLLLEARGDTELGDDIYSYGGQLSTVEVNGYHLPNLNTAYMMEKYNWDQWAFQGFATVLGWNTDTDNENPFDKLESGNIYKFKRIDGTYEPIGTTTQLNARDTLFMYGGFLQGSTRRSDGSIFSIPESIRSLKVSDIKAQFEELKNPSQKQTTRRSTEQNLQMEGYSLSYITDICFSLYYMGLLDNDLVIELERFHNYTVDMFKGLPPNSKYDLFSAEQVIDDFLANFPKIFRKIFKLPFAENAAADISGLKFDQAYASRLFYYLITHPTFYNGGPTDLVQEFVNVFKSLGGTILSGAKVTQFLVDQQYSGTGGETSCPVYFNQFVCEERCSNPQCRKDCRDVAKYDCEGQYRARGVTINQNTLAYSDRIVTTAGFTQNYDVLMPETVRTAFKYDDPEYVPEPVPTINWFMIYSVQNGNSSSLGFAKNADYHLYTKFDEVYAGGMQRVLSASVYNNATTMTPWITVISSKRDANFTAENPDKTYVILRAVVPNQIWQPWEDVAPGEAMNSSYYSLKEQIQTDIIKEVKLLFPSLQFDATNTVAMTPLDFKNEYRNGYKKGALSIYETTVFSEAEKGVPRDFVKGVKNIRVAGSDFRGSGCGKVVWSAIEVNNTLLWNN